MLTFLGYVSEAFKNPEAEKLKAQYTHHVLRAREHTDALSRTDDNDVDLQRMHHLGHNNHMELAKNLSDQHKKLTGKALNPLKLDEAAKKPSKQQRHKVAKAPHNRNDWQKEKSASIAHPHKQDEIHVLKSMVTDSFEKAKDHWHKARNSKSIADEKKHAQASRHHLDLAKDANNRYEKMTGKKIILPKLDD